MNTILACMHIDVTSQKWGGDCTDFRMQGSYMYYNNIMLLNWCTNSEWLHSDWFVISNTHGQIHTHLQCGWGRTSEVKCLCKNLEVLFWKGAYFWEDVFMHSIIN